MIPENNLFIKIESSYNITNIIAKKVKKIMILCKPWYWLQDKAPLFHFKKTSLSK